MSRKDTILVAVLINAGLLIVLFASALKSGADEEHVVKAHEPLVQELALQPSTQEPPRVMGDEVDAALAQYAHQKESQRMAGQELSAMPVTSPTSDHPCLEDLKTTTTTEPSNESMLAQPSVQTLTAPLARPDQRVPQVVEVKVKKGDVLEKLARHHHSSVAEIMKANRLTSTNLHIGQVLQIPRKSEGSSPATAVAHAKTQGVYVVKKGDSVWTVAVKHKMKVEELLKLNNMTSEQAKKLQPGDKLRTSN